MKSRAGFTMIEMLVTCAVMSGVVIMAITTITAFGVRFASDAQAEKADKGANRVMMEFSAAMKGASTYSIYADQATWRFSPANAVTAGNFVIITTNVGNQIAFEYADGQINIINDPAGLHQVLTCSTSASLTAEGTFIFQQDGVPSMAWTVALPTELLEFQTCSQPFSML